MKEIKRKKLTAALLPMLGAGIALSMIAADALAQQAQKVERIEVTGTNIKRVDTETVAPVEIITREQIERSGMATVAELLRNIPAATAASRNETFTNSFAPGAGSISLRGLGQKTTLVLINGRRTAGYGFAQNLQDTFVDINSIPTAAVERIEVLKDGASAIYGSDAIAGVVNIIMRKDFKGLELSAYGGFYEGKHDGRFSITGGMGDLARDRYNISGTFDYYKRDLVELSDTKFGATRDFRGQDGGRNFQSLTGGGTWRQLTTANALTNTNRAITDCKGTVITNTQAVALGLIAPLANAAFDVAGNTFCSRDFNNIFTILPKTERAGFVGRATREFSSTTSGYIDLGLSEVKTFQTFQEPFFAGTTALQSTAVGLRPFTYNINFNPGVAGNPFTTPARYQGVLNDMGTRDTDIDSKTIRVLVGANYVLGSWDMDSGVGWSRNEVEAVSINRTSLSGTSALFNVPITPQPPIPTSTSATYNLDRWTQNSDAVRNSMRATFPRNSTSELSFADTKGNTELGRLAGGPIGLAVGAEIRKEELKDRPDPIATTGNVLGQGITATNGKRNSAAAYAEVAFPITQQFESDVALRWDHYSDYGNSTTPKIGMKYKPNNWILFRANWGKGFRAPTLPEISPSVATFFTSVIDPLTNQAVQVSGVFAGNPLLKPEKSGSSTVGFVLEPRQDVSLSLNYYRIDWKNIVIGDCCQRIVNTGDPTRVIRDPATNAIVTVLGNYVNLSQTITSGFDFEAKYRMTTGWGKVTPSINASYVNSFKEDGVQVAGTDGGSQAIPRLRGRMSVDWDYRAWASTAAWNYISGWKHAQGISIATSFFAPQDPRFQTGVLPSYSKYYSTLDLYTKYTWNKNLDLSAAILNATGRLPPYDPGFGTELFNRNIFDVRGRQYRIGFTYKM